jgi:hypothetical protein
MALGIVNNNAMKKLKAEVPLALGQNQSETIPTLLDTGQQKQR